MVAFSGGSGKGQVGWHMESERAMRKDGMEATYIPGLV